MKAALLDRDPTQGATAEWLVISTGLDSGAATEAVKAAREQGMRVNHLLLDGVNEAEILRAAIGAKHIVVAEALPAPLAVQVRKLLPQIGVVQANSAKGPVPTELILERLLRTPRCC